MCTNERNNKAIDSKCMVFFFFFLFTSIGCWNLQRSFWFCSCTLDVVDVWLRGVQFHIKQICCFTRALTHEIDVTKQILVVDILPNVLPTVVMFVTRFVRLILRIYSQYMLLLLTPSISISIGRFAWTAIAFVCNV